MSDEIEWMCEKCDCVRKAPLVTSICDSCLYREHRHWMFSNVEYVENWQKLDNFGSNWSFEKMKTRHIRICVNTQNGGWIPVNMNESTSFHFWIITITCRIEIWYESSTHT